MIRVHRNFDDIEELCHALEAWDVDMFPLTTNRRGTKAGEVIQIGNQECLYSYAGFNNSLKMSGAPPHGLITFNLMESTPKPYWWRGNSLDSDMVWVFPEGGELQSISPQGFGVYTLSVTEKKVACTAAEYGIDLPPPSKRPEVFQVQANVVSIIRSKMRQVSHFSNCTLDEMVDLTLPVLVSLWLAPENPIELRIPSTRARDRAIRKALEMIESCDLVGLTAASFLKESFVSERTLQYAFLEHFGSSPSAVIKSLRLATTRIGLRKATWREKTVADIAHEAGFQHMPQFAIDYRRAFGELPSATLRQSE